MCLCNRSLGLKQQLAVFVSLLYAYTPSLAIHATTGNNDLPVAFVYLLIVVLLLDWQGASAQQAFKRLLLIGMALCLAMGTKPYIIFLAPGLLLFGVWSHRRRGRPGGSSQSRTDSFVGGKIEAEWSGAIAVICFVGSSALLLGGYWFARNMVVFGNPFHPTDFSLFGQLIYGTG